MKTVAVWILAAAVLLAGVVALAQAPMPFTRMTVASAPTVDVLAPNAA